MGADGFTHLDPKGRASMVDVSAKEPTRREAVASAMVFMSEATFKRLSNRDIPKGDVFSTARIAGIMAAKKVGGLIPLCHPLPLEYVGVDFELLAEKNAVEIRATAAITAKTGVEMEALTAVSVAALTIYDMCKALDKGMEISQIRLLRKSGGKSGDWHRR